MIAKALTRNAVLQALDVSDNAIRAAGLQAFVDCLQYNHTLSSIMTIGNPGFDNDARAEDIVRMRMEAGVQVMDHHERTGQLEYKVRYTLHTCTTRSHPFHGPLTDIPIRHPVVCIAHSRWDTLRACRKNMSGTGLQDRRHPHPTHRPCLTGWRTWDVDTRPFPPVLRCRRLQGRACRHAARGLP